MAEGPEVALRHAGSADVGPIVVLVESAYRGESSRAGWTTEAHLLDGQRTDEGEVAEAIARDGSIVLLAERAGELLGCCQLLRLEEGGAYFGMFAVRPQLQGAGVGSALLAAAEGSAVGSGAQTMRMTVLRQRPDLIAFYGRRGYVATGETLPFPYGDECFGIPRRDDLEFVVLEKPIG